mmetsp:Transcript_52243/g.113837  ORF Transcript_52243/g.113837 Transcript_52243/m.113837 type:complete len:275 (+) Transcript_52243:856-1680(+)
MEAWEDRRFDGGCPASVGNLKWEGAAAAVADPVLAAMGDTILGGVVMDMALCSTTSRSFLAGCSVGVAWSRSMSTFTRQLEEGKRASAFGEGEEGVGVIAIATTPIEAGLGLAGPSSPNWLTAMSMSAEEDPREMIGAIRPPCKGLGADSVDSDKRTGCASSGSEGGRYAVWAVEEDETERDLDASGGSTGTGVAGTWGCINWLGGEVGVDGDQGWLVGRLATRPKEEKAAGTSAADNPIKELGGGRGTSKRSEENMSNGAGGGCQGDAESSPQ